MCFKVVRGQFQCSSVAGDRVCQLSLLLQHIAEVVERRGIVRVQFDCSLIAGNRGGQLPQLIEHIAQVVVKDTFVPLQLNRSFNVLDGDFRLAHLVSSHAKKMHRVRLIWVDRENLPIHLLGFLQAAGVMVLDGNCKCFRNCGHRAMMATEPVGCKSFEPAFAAGVSGRVRQQRYDDHLQQRVAASETRTRLLAIPA